MLASLALLAATQGAFRLRYAPAPDVVTTFAYEVAITPKGGGEPTRARWQVAERAKPEGENVRVVRYVSLVTVDDPRAGTPGAQSGVKEFERIDGKSFRFLIAPDGTQVAESLGKYDNPTRDYFSLDLKLPIENVAAGFAWTTSLGAESLSPKIRASVRGVRALPGGDEAVIVDLAPDASNPKESESIGRGSYAVLSRRDGRYLLAHLTSAGARNGETGEINVQRVNAPGLDRLASELRFPKR